MHCVAMFNMIRRFCWYNFCTFWLQDVFLKEQHQVIEFVLLQKHYSWELVPLMSLIHANVCHPSMVSFVMSELYILFCAGTTITFEQYRADWRQIFLRICERVRLLWRWKVCRDVFSLSTSLWPSPDHSSPLDDTETSSPRKETPCSPVGRQSKVHCSSCVSVCMSVFKRNGGKRRTVSIHTH